MDSIFAKRLIFVSGKGGVGKTTLAMALGLLAADQGRRTLLIEIDTSGVIPERFGKSRGELGRPVELRPGLSSMIVEGRAALSEYLRLILPGPVIWPILGSKIYDYFVAGAPGLKELMCMGKIFYEVDRAEKGRPSWDIVIVDAPATGHGLELFRMPQAAHDTFAVGLVHRETERVLKLLRDPALTVHLLVTLAEDLPVSETIELHRALDEELRFPLGPVLVNRIHPAALSAQQVPIFEAYRASVREGSAMNELLLDVIDQTEILHIQHEENLRQIERIQRELGGSLVTLPALFEESLEPRFLDPIVRALDEQLVGGSAAASASTARRASEGR